MFLELSLAELGWGDVFFVEGEFVVLDFAVDVVEEEEVFAQSVVGDQLFRLFL